MSNNIQQLAVQSPIGTLILEGSDGALSSIRFTDPDYKLDQDSENSIPILKEAKAQLQQYFNGNLDTFNLPLQPGGTDFEQQVWQQLGNIPIGSTITYKQLAQRVGNANKAQAVGRANGQNPIPIVIPCHRVIGSNNKLTGYAGGINRKLWLLQHEGSVLL